MADEELISIVDAAAKGIKRVRQPIWADPMDHIKIDIIGGAPGPWLHLFGPFNKECNGRDPVDLLWPVWPLDVKAAEFVPYTGPLPDSQEYQARALSFVGT